MNPSIPSSLKSDIEALTDFCVENAELTRLGSMLAEFNIFEAAGLTRDEVKHSRFLSFLLSPSEAHGLGDSFLRRFLQRALRGSQLEDLGVSALNLELWDLSDTEVRVEWANIDILILNYTHRLAVIVENKVGSGEHSGQLDRYYSAIQHQFSGWKIVPVFLSPFGLTPSDPRYMPIDYEVVATIIEGLATSPSRAPAVVLALQHYIQVLRRHVVTDSSVKDLCREIYRKHKKALDLIFDYRQDHVGGVLEYIIAMIDTDEAIARGQNKENSTTFLPVSWTNWMPVSEETWWASEGWLMLFWFEASDAGIKLVLCIGPGDRLLAQACLNAAQANKPPFNPQRREVGKHWSRLFTTTLVPAQIVGTADTEQIIGEFDSAWRQFVNSQMPFLESVLSNAVKEVAP